MNYTRRSKEKSLKIFRWLKQRKFMFVEERTVEDLRFVACFAYVNGKWRMQSFTKEGDLFDSYQMVLTWESIFRHVERIWRES
jgi:hypothetical protein